MLLVHFFKPLKDVSDDAMAFASQVFCRFLGYLNYIAMRVFVDKAIYFFLEFRRCDGAVFQTNIHQLTDVASPPGIFEGKERFNELASEVRSQKGFISIKDRMRPVFIELFEDVVILRTVIFQRIIGINKQRMAG